MDDGARRERHFAADLLHWIPAGIFYSGGNEQITDINFAQFIFIDFVQNAPVNREIGCTFTDLVYECEHMRNIGSCQQSYGGGSEKLSIVWADSNASIC